MAFDKVDPKVDFPALERDVLAMWDATRAFDALREINKGGPKWSFLDGPITANNPMGVHHAWGRTYKDLYQRYFAGIGCELRYQNGFDCQGLWVEVEVEKEHGFATKKDIETYGVGKFVEECKARANKFAAIQTEQSKRLGYWMDWDNSYYTMSEGNNYGIWAFLKKCHEQGKIYKGSDVMPWCPRCGTGLSQMEMNEGYREVGHTSVFVIFPLVGRENENLLVWTTTPWTLSSNVAAAVKPDMTYLKVRQGDQIYYVGKGNFGNARSQPIANPKKGDIPSLMSIQAMFKNGGAFEIVEEVKGETLVGLKYDGPFDMLEGAAEAVAVHQVIAWDEVTESEGTGIVHIAPGCGAEDYALGKELSLPRIAPLNEDGTFKLEFGMLAGKRFDTVADEVVADLKERSRLFAKEKYFHRYPHCWRCKDELVYRLVDEWFIRMDWREKIMDSTRQARWIPEWGVDRELDWLRNMGDWMISKKRFWGLALPIWECESCGEFEVLGSRAELKARAATGWEEFEGHTPHRPYVDGITIKCEKCGGGTCHRVKDVGNPWLDASIVPFSTMGYFDNREYWEEWFPADFIVESLPGQFRNWFYALLAISTMMVEKSPFKVVKGHGLVMDDEGKAMHKSEGNAIWFDEAAEKFGVDVMRWLYAGTSPERNVLFGPVHCDETRRDVVLPWWNVYSFFCNLARVDGFDPNQHTATAQERSLLDKWILSDLHKLVRLAHECYSEFNIEKFCAEARRFIDVLSTWYLRRSRRRFYGEGWPADKRAAYATLYEVLTTFNRVIAPITVFLSENIYQNLVAKQLSDAPASVHHVPFPKVDESLIDESLSAHVAASIRLTSLGRSARKESKLKVRQPLAELVVVPADDTEKQAAEMFAEHLVEELNVKKVTLRESAGDAIQASLEPNMKMLGPRFGKSAAAARDAITKLDAADAAAKLAAGGSVEIVVDGETAEIGKDFVAIEYGFGDGWAGAVDGKTAVLLSTALTDELIGEGLARDLVRNIQNLRKDSGLDIADRIRLGIVTESDAVGTAVTQCDDYIKAETLTVDLTRDPIDSPLGKAEVALGKGNEVLIFLEKA